jgi:hypothetical protein
MSSTVTTIHTQPRAPLPATVGMSVMCPDPDCGQPAEVVDAWVWSSTDGPVPHARTRCLLGHVFTPPSGWLIPLDASRST